MVPEDQGYDYLETLRQGIKSLFKCISGWADVWLEPTKVSGWMDDEKFVVLGKTLTKVRDRNWDERSFKVLTSYQTTLEYSQHPEEVASYLVFVFCVGKLIFGRPLWPPPRIPQRRWMGRNTSQWTWSFPSWVKETSSIKGGKNRSSRGLQAFMYWNCEESQWLRL